MRKANRLFCKRLSILVAMPASLIGCIAVLALSQQQAVVLNTENKVPNDPLQWVNQSPDVPHGELTYLVNTLPPGPPRPVTYDLVLRTTGKGASLGKPVSLYQITADPVSLLYTCQFSPDGHFILFKEGLPYGTRGSYHFYLWDVGRKQLQQGPEASLSYRNLLWSPGSRYVAYVQGGDADGEQVDDSHPMRLYVYDVVSHGSHFIAQNPEVKMLSWSLDDTLLYTAKPFAKEDTPFTYNVKRPSIYEASIKDGNSIKVIDDGSEPTPSPSGRWVVFVGWPDAAQEASAIQTAKMRGERYQSKLGLYLYDVRQKKRVLIHNIDAGTAHDVLLWSSDEKELYSIENVYKNTHPPYTRGTDTNDYPGYGEGHVREIDVPSLHQHEITVLHAKDDMARQDPESQFRIGGISANSKYLFVYVHQIVDDNPNSSYYSALRSLEAINLGSGATTALWTAKNAEGMDWRELP